MEIWTNLVRKRPKRDYVDGLKDAIYLLAINKKGGLWVGVSEISYKELDDAIEIAYHSATKDPITHRHQ